MTDKESTVPPDRFQELEREVRRVIESNRAFLAQLMNDEVELEEPPESMHEEIIDDFEEL
ncbi:MAG TPA: hypothetical protein VFR01_08700 [Geobacterales bacterium]|nr:hypothetical protein [Geobacterales bacterium]